MKNYGNRKYSESLQKTLIVQNNQDLRVKDLKIGSCQTLYIGKNSKLTITLTSVENPLEFGVVIANEEGKIEKFLEKPSWGEVFSDTINTGIYIIEPEILEYIPKNENFDFGSRKNGNIFYRCPLYPT